MALHWKWDKKIGEATLVQGDREFFLSLYDGNAFLIMLYEYTADGKDVYDLFGFFVDKQHAKNCLGLTKGYENLYNGENGKITKLRLSKEYRYLKDLTAMLVKAFDDITIEIYSD